MGNILKVPSELQVLGVYMPPFFLVCLLGLLCAVILTNVLNWTGFGRFFWHPPLAFLALWVLAASLIGLVLIAP